jgi:tetratricopeptide (TPR) repeat protein
VGEVGAAIGGATRWLGGRSASAHAFRVALAAALFLWGGADQLHFFLGADENNLRRLERAASMNPYDASVQMRIARAESLAGERDKAAEALTRAIAANPANPEPQHARARELILDGRYDEAYRHYQQMLRVLPRDPDALVSFGMVAAKLNHVDEAMESWQKAIDVDPKQSNAQLYLAQGFDQQGKPAVAARHYQAYLDLEAAHASPQAAEPRQIISVTIALADAYAHSAQGPKALAAYQSAVDLAERAGDVKQESLALARRGEFLERAGDVAGASRSYQRGLAIDARSGSPLTEAIDWFNYGQFLRRQGQPERLAYACFLHAENLLTGSPGEELDTARNLRRQSETHLGDVAAAVRKNLDAVLAEAASLPETAFAAHP